MFLFLYDVVESNVCIVSHTREHVQIESHNFLSALFSVALGFNFRRKYYFEKRLPMVFKLVILFARLVS